MSWEDDYEGDALERNLKQVKRVMWFTIGFILGAALAHLANWMLSR